MIKNDKKVLKPKYPHLVVLVVDHLGDEGPRLGAPGLGAGLAGGGPVA